MGHFFPSLVHLQTNVCDCQNITREKWTNTQNLMEVIVASLILKKLSSLEDLSYTYLMLQFFMFSWLPWDNPAPPRAHVSVAHLWKYHSLIVLSTSLHEAWVYSGYRKAGGLKIIWGRRAGESMEQSRVTRTCLTYSKVQKATTLLAMFTACCFYYPSQGNP